MHEPLVPVSLITLWAGVKPHISEKLSSFLRSANGRLRLQMPESLQLLLCCCFFYVSSVHYLHILCLMEYAQQQQQQPVTHCVSREKQDGRICQGRCPHVSQSAGRKLQWHRHTNAYIAHNIHPICHPGPSEAEAILPH